MRHGATTPNITTSVAGAMGALSLGKMQIYALIKSGDLVSFMHGKSRLILVRSLHEWAERKASEQRTSVVSK